MLELGFIQRERRCADDFDYSGVGCRVDWNNGGATDRDVHRRQGRADVTMKFNNDDVIEGNFGNSNWFSVRCIQE
jgi:hypothetical protein